MEATSTNNAGTTTATATVLYSNMLRMQGQLFNRDLWGQVTFTFSTSPVFSAGQTFEFKIDTDGFAGATLVTPEPSTFGMAGLALAFLAARRRFVKKS